MESKNSDSKVDDSDDTDRETRLAGLRQILIEKLVSSVSMLRDDFD